MRRTTIGLCVVSLLLVPGSVAADPGHERPKITVMRWEDPPVTTAEPGCETDCHEEYLIVKAHDPDSSITEIEVHFGEGQSIAFAHTYCVQGKAPGQPARLKIPVSYSEPGSYDVEAIAYSHRRCLPHEDDDGHPIRRSRVKHLATTVVDGG